MTCCSKNSTSIYKPRKPEKLVLHEAVRGTFNRWWHQKEKEDSPPCYSQKVFSAFLKCGIPAHGFARAHCGKCSRNFFIPFSCKQRGVCPGCATKRMVECAAHATDHLFPLAPVRQWVISFPKRIRPFFKNKKIKAQVLKIVVGEIDRRIIICSGSPNAKTGGISFFQCFGAKLNYHPHFHLCYVDGAFTQDLDTLKFSQAPLTPDDIQDTEDLIRKRVLKLFGRKKWIEKSETEEMLKWENSGFSLNLDSAVQDAKAMQGLESESLLMGGEHSQKVKAPPIKSDSDSRDCVDLASSTAESRLNASVHVEAFDRPALERLIRYCARPSFVSENLRWNRDILVYRLPKVYKDGLSSIQLKPLEFLDRISTLIPQPRVHLHHYHGVLAANAPFRKEITAHANKLMEEHIPEAPLLATAPKPKRSYSWQKLLARIYEVFPLTCTCGEAMKIIAFITNPHTARHILSHLKLCTNPFDPLPFEREPEYTICDLLSYTEDGFPDSYDIPRSQPVPEVIRWKGSSAHKNKEAFANEYEPIPEYEICDLLPGTPDGFPDPYDDWLDSS